MTYARMAMIMSQSSKFEVDPLSDVLARLGAYGVRMARLEASGAWSLAFPEMARLKFVAVMRGACWILLPGRPPLQLTAGDIFVIGGAAYTVASDPAVAPVDGLAFYGEGGSDEVRLNGDDTVMLGGAIAFANDEAGFLFDGLPSFMCVSCSSPSAANVSRALEMLAAEMGQPRLGGSIVSARMAEVLLLEAIRTYVEQSDGGDVGWITALGDAQIGKVLRLMHANLAFPWTVARLANEAGMSRSAFSSRFAQRVGRPPLDYLTRWRMTVARQALAAGGADVKAVAAQVGYASQSAFGHAYKRCFGRSPGRNRRPSSAAPDPPRSNWR